MKRGFENYDFAPRRIPAIPANAATKIATLSDVYQDISLAIRPCSTAPGKRSGIVQAHKILTKKSATIKAPKIKAKTPGTIATNHFLSMVLFIILSLSHFDYIREICNYLSVNFAHKEKISQIHENLYMICITAFLGVATC